VRELAKRLMQQPAEAAASLSAIVGSTSADVAQVLAELDRPRLRIGLWPILNDSLPEIAMGIAAVLGLLLEHWQEVRVYRLFAKLEGEPDNYNWTVQQSQFKVDDWQLEGLDENVAVWGTLTQDAAARWHLMLEVESDVFVESSDETKSLAYEAESVGHLVELLPRAAADIAYLLGADEDRLAVPVYTSVVVDDDKVNKLLGYLFRWELDLLFHTWGKRRSDEAVVDAADRLLLTGQACGDEFSAWAVPGAISRAMLPLFDPIRELLVPTVQEVVSTFPSSAKPAMLLATALFRSGYAEQAYDLLESSLETHPASADVWLALAELYWRGLHVNQAVDTFQRAIERDCTSAALFARYGDVMMALDSQGWHADEFILIDPGQITADFMAWEAIEAYEAALEMVPSNVDALFRQVILLADKDAERLWPKFARLVEVDRVGDKVRSAIDSLYHVDDISPAIRALQAAIGRDDNRYDLYINLAAAYLAAEKRAPARIALESARPLTTSESVQAEIDRLMLAAEDANFEERLGEITDLVSAGKHLSIRDVEFLEATLEKAPRFGDLYLLLARAYQVWGEPDASLETLLDAQKILPDDPDILAMLARILWASGEQKLAFDSLNQGLAKNPHHVPLLSLTGRYLFENGQEDAARAFLVRAEAIAPRHPALNETRSYIARMRS
jgi:tetratricopeptide (TPR) repeat protein